MQQQKNLDQKVMALEIKAKQKADKEIADTKKELKERLLDVSRRENSLKADMATCKKEALQAAKDAVSKRETDVTAREIAVAKREADVDRDIDRKTEQVLQDKTKMLNRVIRIAIVLFVMGSFVTGFAQSIGHMIGVIIDFLISIYDWWSKLSFGIGQIIGMIVSELAAVLLCLLLAFVGLIGYNIFFDDDNSLTSYYNFWALIIGGAIIVGTKWIGIDNAAWCFWGCGIVLCIIRAKLL